MRVRAAAGVRRGLLAPNLAGRPHETAGNRRPREMVAAQLVGHRTRLTGSLGLWLPRGFCAPGNPCAVIFITLVRLAG